jgi:hypothetical protein
MRDKTLPPRSIARLHTGTGEKINADGHLWRVSRIDPGVPVVK